jgi:hypothetical protein
MMALTVKNMAFSSLMQTTEMAFKFTTSKAYKIPNMTLLRKKTPFKIG